MRIFNTGYCFLFCLSITCIPQVYAQDNACLMEGSFTYAGKTTKIKDCLKNDGISETQFKETCNGLSQSVAKFGGPAAKITYMPACPSSSQGQCANFFGKPLTSYYYKRNSKSLSDIKSGCISQGGTWK